MTEKSFIEQISEIWFAGGPLMYPLAILGILIYAGIAELWLYLRRHNYYRTDQNEWAHWVDLPADAKGEVGEVVRFAQEGVSSVDEIRGRFAEMREAHMPRLSLRLMSILVMINAAPLAGLLGTVTGMLATFLGLSIASGGNSIDLVAGGISEALITTETGLMIAIPGYVLIYQLRKQVAELDLFFTRLEILTILKFNRTHRKALIA